MGSLVRFRALLAGLRCCLDFLGFFLTRHVITARVYLLDRPASWRFLRVHACSHMLRLIVIVLRLAVSTMAYGSPTFGYQSLASFCLGVSIDRMYRLWAITVLRVGSSRPVETLSCALNRRRSPHPP